MVEIHFEDIEILELSPEFFVSWLSDVCALHEKQLGELSLVFCSDDYLLEMNRTHLDHDYYTDIITFDYCEEGCVSGDLFISVDRVRENAGPYSSTFERELFRVVVHGVLHLIGFKDKSEEDEMEMRRQEDVALSRIVPRET